MSERVRRGKYARLICRGCRSRKIKCVLPSVHDLAPLNTPQPIEKCCDRCRNLNLECVVDYTLLGRSQSKRSRLQSSEDRTHSDYVPEEGIPVISSLDIKDFLFADEGDGILSQGHQPDIARSTRKEEIFQSMIQANYFFISVLAKDRAFGADIPHATSNWNTPLPDLISHDMAASFDKCLVWHRFFLPKLPTLVNLRARLNSDESATSINCATRLLFALLCVAGFDLHRNISREDWRLKQKLQLAVSFYGQEFIFSPPTHHDSLIVSLFLSDYKPTALATMQGIAHKTIKSEIYINIAYGVFHRLEAVNGEGSQDLSGLNAADYETFEKCLFDSIQGIQMVSNHATVDGLIKKPHQSLRHLTVYMKTRIDAYQNALKSRQCTPQAIYHIQWATSTYILFQMLAEAKQSLHDPGRFIELAEETKKRCLEQINYTNSLLAVVHCGDNDEIAAVRSVLELRFYTVQNWIIALGFLYTSSLGTRSKEEGVSRTDSDISRDETIQITSQITNILKRPEERSNDYLKEYLERYGSAYPDELSSILEKFIGCSKLKLRGIDFHPPARYICLENVIFCKNILENNIVQIKCSGHLQPGFSKQLDLFQKSAEALANMASSPILTVEAAFAGGCIYAMSSKIVFGFLSLMKRLQIDFKSSADKVNIELVDAIIASAEYDGLPSVDLDQFQFPAGMNSEAWPSVGPFGQVEAFSNSFDWTSLLNLDDTEFEVENPAWIGGNLA
ncbi:unnamed protein product [Penicillium pancosmium]